MRRQKTVLLSRTAAVVLSGAATTMAGAQQREAAAPLMFDGVTVVDVEQGKLLPMQRVIITGNRIQAMGAAETIKPPKGARLVDAKGKYLIPGLWDLHTHSRGSAAFTYPLFVANGVTGIRDAASEVPLDTLVRWRREILAGTRIGPPRQVLSSPSIDDQTQPAFGAPKCPQPRPVSYHICFYDAADARHLVDSFKAAGADMLKTYWISEPMYYVVAAAARRVGIPFGGHLDNRYAGPGLTALEASDSGASIIDHLGFGSASELDTLCGGRTATVARCGPLAERFRRNGTWVVVTLNSYANMQSPVSQRLVKLSEAAAAKFWDDSLGTGNWLRDTVKSDRADSAGSLAVAHRVGLPILAGTDVGPDLSRWRAESPGLSIHTELAVLATEGLSPLEALRTATLNPAKLIRGTDSLGTIAPGKLADLVLLDADPLADITHTTLIRAVVANGRYFDRSALDKVLTEARAKAKARP